LRQLLLRPDQHLIAAQARVGDRRRSEYNAAQAAARALRVDHLDPAKWVALLEHRLGLQRGAVSS